MTKYFILFSVLFTLNFGCYESDYPISEDQVDVSESDSVEVSCDPIACNEECNAVGSTGICASAPPIREFRCFCYDL